MSVTPDNGADESAEVATDLVAYFVVDMPNWDSLAEVVPTLAQLAASGVMRILDVVVVQRDVSGAVSVFEPEAVESLSNVRDIEGVVGGLLSDGDVELASLAIRPGTVGVVVVTEDRWASPLAAAVRGAGGQIVAGERVPAHRVEAVLTDPAVQDAHEAEHPEER